MKKVSCFDHGCLHGTFFGCLRQLCQQHHFFQRCCFYRGYQRFRCYC